MTDADTIARLYAAAPTMLAALYKAQVALCDAWTPDDKAALRAVNAAISEAEQQEQTV